MEGNQGTVRRQVSEFAITDPNVKDIVINVLKDNGYDIELKPIIQDPHFYIGDVFKVFRKE
ncbi:hypothetical protein [Clostridium sp.]|uniref:hypothetical protein n=1 Tax=Clostridium sp. TaxID=1506 RepID=UPI003464A8A3